MAVFKWVGLGIVLVDLIRQVNLSSRGKPNRFPYTGFVAVSYYLTIMGVI